MIDTIAVIATTPQPATTWQIACAMLTASIFTFSILNSFWGPNQ